MSNPTDEALNAAVAKAADFSRTTSGWISKGQHFDHLWDNWNVLMAAVAKLENQGAVFKRTDNVWQVKCNISQHWWYQPGNTKDEARALALCIYAVMNQ